MAGLPQSRAGVAQRVERTIVVGLAVAVALCAAVAGWQQAGAAARPLEPDAIALRLNPNTAPQDALELLPGIGPRLAEAIVAERTRPGAPAFQTPDDLVRVHRIGPALAGRLARHWVFEAEDAVPDRQTAEQGTP